MKNRILAALTAFTCTAAMTLSVSAGEYAKDSSGLLSYVTTYSYYGLMVETDGTELTEEMVSGIDGFQGLYNWEAYCSSDHAWTELLTDCTPEGTAYMIHMDTNNKQTLTQLSRQLALNLDCVTNVQYVTRREYQRAVMAWKYTVETKSEDIVLDASTIPELSEFTCAQFEEAPSDVGTVYTYVFAGDAENSELFPNYSTGWDGQQSYDAYQLWNAFGQELVEKYSDILSSVRVETNLLEDAVEYEAVPVSPWQTAGDHNADGETNSNDAAALLVQAAEDGAAEASAETVSPDSDVNLDGVADATDAAYILQYSALKGAGMDPDWVEILKK